MMEIWDQSQIAGGKKMMSMSANAKVKCSKEQHIIMNVFLSLI